MQAIHVSVYYTMQIGCGIAEYLLMDVVHYCESNDNSAVAKLETCLGQPVYTILLLLHRPSHWWPFCKVPLTYANFYFTGDSAACLFCHNVSGAMRGTICKGSVDILLLTVDTHIASHIERPVDR